LNIGVAGQQLPAMLQAEYRDASAVPKIFAFVAEQPGLALPPPIAKLPGPIAQCR
jgi:hypothetical protein